MHIAVILTGIKDSVDKFITQLQGKFLPFKNFKLPGQPNDSMIQVQVRPIQLYDIVFPKEYRDLMLNTILPEGAGTEPTNKKHGKWIAVIRKILGFKKIEGRKEGIGLPLFNQNIRFVVIGEKDDEEAPIDTHEAL